jgi:ATPase subunit of ABC transporter with duplicated ATPase domains
MPKIVIGGLQRRAEETRAAAARLADRQRSEAETAARLARDRIEVIDPLSAGLPSTGLPASRTVLELDRVTAGYAKSAPVIRDFSLTITGPERIAIVGPNGSGKSTLLALIAGALEPWSGTVQTPVPLAIFDQNVSLLDPARSIADNFLARNSEATNRAALARFRFGRQPPIASSERSAAARCCAPDSPAFSASRKSRAADPRRTRQPP